MSVKVVIWSYTMTCGTVSAGTAVNRGITNINSRTKITCSIGCTSNTGSSGQVMTISTVALMCTLVGFNSCLAVNYVASMATGTWGYRWIQMTAAEATDDSGWVEYFFECTTKSDLSSGWQYSCDYEVRVGGPGLGHRFRVKTRDQFGNETAWSELLQAG